MQDITLNITDRNGQIHTIEAPTDMNLNLMEVVRMYELAEEGTIGVCGGMALCASCQCYVLNDVLKTNRNDDEEAMLSEANYVKPNSRLGCQINITSDIDGLSVMIAPEQ